MVNMRELPAILLPRRAVWLLLLGLSGCAGAVTPAGVSAGVGVGNDIIGVKTDVDAAIAQAILNTEVVNHNLMIGLQQIQQTPGMVASLPTIISVSPPTPFPTPTPLPTPVPTPTPPNPTPVPNPTPGPPAVIP